jgi:hypothetical protein
MLNGSLLIDINNLGLSIVEQMSLKDSAIFVTGGAGFVGSTAVRIVRTPAGEILQRCNECFSRARKCSPTRLQRCFRDTSPHEPGFLPNASL